MIARGTGTHGEIPSPARSPAENLVPHGHHRNRAGPLVLGVLYEAPDSCWRETGQIRYEQDIAMVEELRREAGWMRVDGDLLAANQLTNRAEDLETAAMDLPEYAFLHGADEHSHSSS